MHRLPMDGSRTFPRLESGLVLLTRPSPRSASLHAIVVNELQQREGGTLWVDSRNNASTYLLNDLAPSPRTLDGVRIARAFTAYQHHSLVTELVERATARTAMIVVPCIGSLYEDDDVPEREGRDLLEASLVVLRELGAALEIPVVLSATTTAPTTDLIAAYAETTIDVTETRHGFKYAADGFETRLYWDEGAWQTTVPYWVELLGSVAPEPAVAPLPAEALDVSA